MTKRWALGFVAAAATAFSGSAGAITLIQGDTYTVGWDNDIDGATLDTTVQFFLTSLTGTTATFAVHVENNSSGPGQNRLVSFGIDTITPTLTGATAFNPAGTVNWTATRSDSMPGGFGTVDLCVWAGSNCSGGGNSGLREGETDSFTLVLTGSFLGSITFGEPYAGRFQSVGVQEESYTVSGRSVPEPGPLALFAFGLGALALRRRPQGV